jgi:hypothetical protein
MWVIKWAPRTDPGRLSSEVRIPKTLPIQNGPFTMRKIVALALAAGAALAAIAAALADPQLSAECLEMDRLRATANSVHALADLFEARLRDAEKVGAEESKAADRAAAEPRGPCGQARKDAPAEKEARTSC